jgi:hypothetical protein
MPDHQIAPLDFFDLGRNLLRKPFRFVGVYFFDLLLEVVGVFDGRKILPAGNWVKSFSWRSEILKASK